MKKILTIICGIAAITTIAEIECDYEDGEKSTVLMTPEVIGAASAMFGEDAEALLNAIRLQMDKYDRDVKTDAGRRSWHGKLIKEEIYTNELCKVQVYSNDLSGAVWRYKTAFRPREASKPKPATLTTAGIPKGLAAVRARRNAERTNDVQTVTIEINAGSQRKE